MAGDAGGDDDWDDDVDVVDVVVACDAAPFVAASATPVAPAPMPAARNAVMTKRRARPLEVDTIYPSFLLAVLQAVPARCRQHAWPDPAASRGAALSGL
ncbi:MAG TPA: hypothetical protein VMV07_08630 [Streptosporangiaceae bacterium]|nr:hypothetical protein [Streptosporangiaceae bacterium]